MPIPFVDYRFLWWTGNSIFFSPYVYDPDNQLQTKLSIQDVRSHKYNTIDTSNKFATVMTLPKRKMSKREMKKEVKVFLNKSKR